MRATSRRWTRAWIGLLLALVATWALAADAPGAVAATVGVAAADEPAQLRLLNRDVVVLRARVGGLTPKQRVQRTLQRIRDIPPEQIDAPLTAVPTTIGNAKGRTVMLGERPLFSLVDADLDEDERQTLDGLVKETLVRLEEVRLAWHELHDGQRLLRSAGRTAAATLVLALLVWVTYRASRVAVVWMEQKRDVLAARYSYVDWREFLARVAVGSMQLIQWLVLAVIGYAWFYFVLDSFDLTSPLARSLKIWLDEKLVWIGEGLLDSVPGLATVAIVLIFTRVAVDLIRYFFEAVQKGRIRLRLFHPETTAATQRIFTMLAWAIGIAIAYPYLPGASTEAFKGISVLLGVMLTLGSAGLITQAMSGLVVVYSRSLGKGDFVDINGVQGVVTEVAALATKVVNVRNEEITIPNSVVVSTPIRNYSKLGRTQGTLLTVKVTIGYSSPWRQVQALLVEAAIRTPGVRDMPAPYVYQRALSDFYVEYELFASIDDPARRIPIQSDLHAAILDAFNAHGVQIMSPHFLSQPDAAVLVPREHWYAAPARPPGPDGAWPDRRDAPTDAGPPESLTRTGSGLPGA
jgi:small-conductance mechanosensitive channel